MTQKPGAAGVAVVPETVHRSGVSERNDTTRFSFASVEASNLTGWPTVVSFGWPKVIRCGRRAGP
jgi:hypothetical protein